MAPEILRARGHFAFAVVALYRAFRHLTRPRNNPGAAGASGMLGADRATASRSYTAT